MLSNILENTRVLLKPNAASLLANGHRDMNCFVIYGNDQLFLNAFIDLFVMKHADKKTLNKKSTDLYDHSEYHYEFDFSKENYLEQLDFMKKLKKTKTLTDIVYVIYIKKLPQNKCKVLHNYIDKVPSNIIVFIAAEKLGTINTNIQSRASMIHIGFDKPAIYEYCMNNTAYKLDNDKFDTIYRECGGNIIAILLRLESNLCPSDFERRLSDLLVSLKSSRSFLVVITKIRDFVYKAYHMNVPFHYICRLIIKTQLEHPNIQRICELCARCEHTLNTTYKDIFIYEGFFIDLRDMLKKSYKE